MYMCILMCIYFCVYIYMRIYIYVYKYKYTHTHLDFTVALPFRDHGGSVLQDLEPQLVGRLKETTVGCRTTGYVVSTTAMISVYCCNMM